MNQQVKDYALMSAAKQWRDYKAYLKMTKFDKTKTDIELLALRDFRVCKKDWLWLINHWRNRYVKTEMKLLFFLCLHLLILLL